MWRRWRRHAVLPHRSRARSSASRTSTSQLVTPASRGTRDSSRRCRRSAPGTPPPSAAARSAPRGRGRSRPAAEGATRSRRLRSARSPAGSGDAGSVTDRSQGAVTTRACGGTSVTAGDTKALVSGLRWHRASSPATGGSGLITRRSQVQILPSQPRETPGQPGVPAFSLLLLFAETNPLFANFFGGSRPHPSLGPSAFSTSAR